MDHLPNDCCTPPETREEEQVDCSKNITSWDKGVAHSNGKTSLDEKPAYCCNSALSPDEKQSTSSKNISFQYIPDVIHDGLEFPTEEERKTLRRTAESIPLIFIIELAERFAFSGSSIAFSNFVQQPLPFASRTGAGLAHSQSGALGLGSKACFVTPLLGGYIADTYLGRFSTICIAIAVSFLGQIILVVAAIPGVIEHPSAVIPFGVALVVIGIGNGLIQANIGAFIAEQCKGTRLFVVTMKSGERVVVDPILTISRTFLYFFLVNDIGLVAGEVGIAYAEKYVGFWLAYTIPAIVLLLCPRFAARGRWSPDPVRTFRRLTADDFWENVKPSKQVRPKPMWMTFDDNWVDEVRRGLKACAVFCWYPIYRLASNQLSDNLPSQAMAVATHVVPLDIVSNLYPITLPIFIFIFDFLIYPRLRYLRINFSPLKKITTGFIAGCFALIWTAVVQHYIHSTNPCQPRSATCRDISPLSVWIQTGSYILIASSDILAAITGLEYAFTKAPVNMRSSVMAVFIFTSAISAALGEAFINALGEDPLLVWNYGAMAVLVGVMSFTFWFAVRKLDAEEDALNDLKKGHLEAFARAEYATPLDLGS
ncbi:peptide transporter PTR2A [Collybia nuda]|uniref:Peptide transporter PTR2A n=1 Tax=Collybia nuda TaxID=64659 RepID=A0A9P5XZ63_9AGAR|nr:peptide transporter PTR2A [Collybia nuda]